MMIRRVMIVLLWVCWELRPCCGEKERNRKEHKICSVLGGMELTRLTSFRTRILFQEVIEDLELIREYVSESMYNRGIVGGMHNLEDLASTLDWQGRGLNNSNLTTVDIGIAYVDDRPDRRIDRRVGVASDPRAVGTAEVDMAIIDSASNILPWIVDRKSVESKWWGSHQNGRTEGATKEKFYFEQLYTAASIVAFNDAFLFYPPLNKLSGRTSGASNPTTFGDAVGSDFSFSPFAANFEAGGVYPPGRPAAFGPPYSDLAIPGLALVSAYAPIYYTGEFMNYTYNDTLIAVASIDINMTAVSSLLKDLENTLTSDSFAFLVDASTSTSTSTSTNGSFAFLVDASTSTWGSEGTWQVTVISQDTVKKIYPARTGMEEERVVYAPDGETVLVDRRNQTYLVGDTILESVINLTNADWKDLFLTLIDPLKPGDRGHSKINITLTGETDPTLFYAMYEKWPDVSEWVLLSFAPVDQVDNAIHPVLHEESLYMEELVGAERIEAQAVLRNEGFLDLSVSIKSLPHWVELSLPEQGQQQHIIHKGQNLTLPFMVLPDQLPPGTTSELMTLHINDDGYPDCLYSQDMSFTITVHLKLEEDLNQIGSFRYLGFAAAGIIVATSIGFIVWVQLMWKNNVVRTSQPIFLHMLCIGTLVMGASIIPLSIDDSIASTRGCDIACMAFPWLFTTGFSVIFSALFSKIWRLNQIVAAANSFRRIQVTERDVMIPFAILFGLDVLLLLLWTLLEPLQWTRVQTSESESYGTCWGPSSNGSQYGGTAMTSLIILLIVVNGGAVFLANFQAYRARHMSDELSESKYIGIAMACILQIFAVGIPLLFLVHESPSTFFFVIVSIVFVIAMSMLLLIFVPKLIFVRKGPMDANRSSSSLIRSFRLEQNPSSPSNGRLNGSSNQAANRTPLSNEPQPAMSSLPPAMRRVSFKPAGDLAPGSEVSSCAEKSCAEHSTVVSQQEVDRLLDRNLWLEARVAWLESKLVEESEWDRERTATQQPSPSEQQALKEHQHSELQKLPEEHSNDLESQSNDNMGTTEKQQPPSGLVNQQKQ